MKTPMIVLSLVLPLFFAGESPARGQDDPSGDRGSKHGTAWLGVSLEDMTPKLAKHMHLSTDEGALVNDVVEDSPAEKAGIREGDVIVEFNGKKIADAHDLQREVRVAGPGHTAPVIVIRKGDRVTLQASLERQSRRHGWGGFSFMPPVQPHIVMSYGSPADGLRLMDLTRQLGDYFGAPKGRGVLVEEVEEGSSGDKAGFKAGDVIVELDKQGVENSDDLRDALEGHEAGDTVDVQIIRKGSPMTLALEVARERHNRWFRSHHDGQPFDFEWNPPDDSQDHMQFEEDGFHQQMKNLHDQLKTLGPKLREDMMQLGEKLRGTLNRVTC